jgi:hypothetical protein
MAGRVTVEAQAFPVAIRRLAWRQPGFAQERRQQAVGIEGEQIDAVGRDAPREWTLQETDSG